MNELLNKLVAHIDLLQSQKPKSPPWGGLFENVIHEMESVESSPIESTNPLVQKLAKQNEVLMALAMVAIISAVSK